MLLRAVYRDGNYVYVEGSILSSLIKSREIVMFKRADGWVHVDSPRIRIVGRPSYHTGPERRSN